ncbi:hypothetical protein [Streptomyces sp. NPDC056191]|uniref:hypothetical protein n=1 Tax=Streptomyces sp. NPDC056191 TaxID=3345742 RepID=UPI0035E2B6A6
MTGDEPVRTVAQEEAVHAPQCLGDAGKRLAVEEPGGYAGTVHVFFLLVSGVAAAGP